MLYKSKPTLVEAIHWVGTNFDEVSLFAPEKVMRVQHGSDPARDNHLELLAGKEGAQDWVPVPVGHWLVHPPGDLSDIWPVEHEFFQSRYELP